MSHVILTICWVAPLFEDTPKKNDKTPGAYKMIIPRCLLYKMTIPNVLKCEISRFFFKKNEDLSTIYKGPARIMACRDHFSE